jgi:hypothetical protein
MVVNFFFPIQTASGWLLILSAIIFVIGGFLYTGRAIWKLPAGETHGYLLWERGFVIAAILVATLGLVLLERILEGAGENVFSPLGMTIYLIGVVLVLVAETYNLSKHEWLYAPIVVFISLAFLGQAVFGLALLRTGFLPAWIAWATILWSLGWLIVLPIARPKNMYYPWLHYVAPLLIGIALLLKG